MAIVTPFVRVGTYPTREFRYLRTVIVTAAVYRASIRCSHPSLNLPAPGRRHTLYVHFRVSRVLCFNKQSQPPILCNPPAFGLFLQATRAHLLPKLRCQFAEFLLPSSLKRLRILILRTSVGLRYGRFKLKLSGFSWKHFQLLREQVTRPNPRHEPGGFACQTPTGQEPGHPTPGQPSTIRPPSHWNRCWNINQLPISYGFRPHLRGPTHPTPMNVA